MTLLPETAKPCDTCYGYGLWGMGESAPMGPIDASDGYPTYPCPECGANANPISAPILASALADSGKGKGIPAPFQASTLRLVADHFNALPQKKVIINPSRETREDWAILLNQIADELEGG